MPETDIDFAKIAATPTPTTWSQAYNAGKLFAVLSLEKEREEAKEEEKIDEGDFLATLGKGILDTLENEYFALESKELESIKNAILITAHKIPEDIKSSFVITAIVKNVLYVFILGSGKVHLKRGHTFGPILQLAHSEDVPIKAASGYVQEKDVIILQTKNFSDVIPSEKLISTIDSLSPSEIVETLAPTIHSHEQGGAAAIIAEFKDISKETATDPSEKKEEEGLVEDSLIERKEAEEVEAETAIAKPTNFLSGVSQFVKGLLGKIMPKGRGGLNHSKKMYLSIAIIILIVLIGSIFLAVKKQNEAKVKAMFNEVYPQATKKFEEGQGLIDLNQNLARDSFNDSKEIIDKNLPKFEKDSDEEKQLLDLLEKVQKAINETSGINAVSAKEVSLDESEFLKFVASSKALGFGQDEEKTYSIDDDTIYSTDKGKDDAKSVIENDGDWEDPVSVIPYLSNVYVLDRVKGGVVKFVGGSSGFGKTSYFSDSEPDLSNAVSMAIDGSIWVLLSDGTVLKYTRGKADAFNVAGLDSSFSNPTKIYTTSDFDNIYILDNGNSRIVVLGKTGEYKEQYSSDVLSSAKELEVLEEDKKILILSGEKAFEISL